MSPSHDVLVARLAELIAIPSVSADPAHLADVHAAAAWVAGALEAAGGSPEVVPWGERPLVLAEIRASKNADGAPTVLCYGHFDVQPPDPLEEWESPPFELTELDGWLVARGIADDKGQLFMLLEAARRLAAAGELPVNLRFACDGEEEIGGHSVVDWVRQDERLADAAVVFDSDMVRRGLPAFDVAVRGLVYLHLTLRAGERDLHSGTYGGAAMNGLHALHECLAAVLPRGGRLPAPLRAGVVAPAAEETDGWSTVPSGAEELEAAGAHPADELADTEFYVRTWAEPSLDVNGIGGGSPMLQKTVIPAVVDANLSIRLVSEQDPDEIAAAAEKLLRDALPQGAELDVAVRSSAPPGRVDPDARAIELGLDAFEHVVGARPVLIRSGGAIPLVSELAAHGIPTILTGFALKESNIHSPNERIPADHLDLGVRTATELFRRLGDLG